MSEIAAQGTHGVAASPAGTPWVRIYLGFGGMVLGQFMAILDIQIVASSLSQIQAGLGASLDEISWVQTIYLLAEVVIIPLTAYLSRLWSTQAFYMAATVAFVVTSVATGLSTSFEMMIVTRALQGLSAGAMIPAVFAAAMTVFPPERRVAAQVINSLVLSLAPTIGPTLGGHLTEALSWRWLFFINVPPSLVVLFLVGRYGGFDKADPKLARGVDWFGLVTMAIFLLALQYVLEEGARDGWFDDDLILWLSVTAVIMGVVFVWRQLTYAQPIVSLRPFRDRNFCVGAVMAFISGMSLFGGVFILPLFLAQILHYSSGQVGTTMVVSGLTLFLTAPLVGRFVRAIEPRTALFIGFSIAAYAVSLGARVNANWGFWTFAWLQALRAFGTMFANIGAQQMVVATLPPELMKETSALFNLIRNVGGAVGLALISTLLTHQTAVHYGDLAARISVADSSTADLMAGLSERMAQAASIDPDGAGRKAFAHMLHETAMTLAFGDAFVFLACGCVAAAVLAAIAKPAKGRR